MLHESPPQSIQWQATTMHLPNVMICHKNIKLKYEMPIDYSYYLSITIKNRLIGFCWLFLNRGRGFGARVVQCTYRGYIMQIIQNMMKQSNTIKRILPILYFLIQFCRHTFLLGEIQVGIMSHLVSLICKLVGLTWILSNKKSIRNDRKYITNICRWQSK